jgi:predicted site-specific integrase-resolvase
MTTLTEQEATFLLHSHGIKCSLNDVTQWLSEGKIKAFEEDGRYTIKEEELYNFLHHYRWEGTAYEPGIDDKTKINRLLEEIEDLKQKILQLQNENVKLEEQSGILPF